MSSPSFSTAEYLTTQSYRDDKTRIGKGLWWFGQHEEEVFRTRQETLS